MRTKLEKQADQLWQNYEAKHQRFWQEYDRLLKVSKSQVVKRSTKTPLVANTSTYVLYGIADSKSLGEKLLTRFELVFATGCTAAIITGLIGTSLGVSTQHFVLIYLVMFGLIFGILRNFFFKKEESSQVLWKQILNFASDHFTIEQDDEIKKVLFKYVERVQYQKHCFKLIVEFPQHGMYEYKIPLFNGKGQKLPKPQIKQLYGRLKMGVQTNR